jgi:hypothetical protein
MNPGLPHESFNLLESHLKLTNHYEKIKMSTILPSVY